jgi:hypothetical protein
MTIYEIKRRLARANPPCPYFSKNSMAWFGQTLKDFKVKKLNKAQRFALPIAYRDFTCYLLRADSYALAGMRQKQKIGTSRIVYVEELNQLIDCPTALENI